MPIFTMVDHERHQVQAFAVGPVTLADVVAHLSIEKRGNGLSYPELMDFRGTGMAFTPDEVRQIGDLIRSMNRETSFGRTALLVSSDATFEVALAIAAEVKDACELKPFRDEKEARVWLAGNAAKGQST